MEILTVPLNLWNKQSIRPGAVGSVGDTMIGVRFKQSSPNMNTRWDPQFSTNQSVYYGMNISDGMHAGFTTGGGVAKTLRKPFGKRLGFKTAVGWKKKDIIPTDRSRTSIMGSAGQYSWKNKVANINNAANSRDLFCSPPNSFELPPGELPRGGQIPGIVGFSGDDRINIEQQVSNARDSISNFLTKPHFQPGTKVKML